MNDEQMKTLHEEQYKMDDVSFNELMTLKKEVSLARMAMSKFYSYMLKNKETLPKDSLLELTGGALMFIEDFKETLNMLKTQILNFELMMYNSTR